MYDNLEKEKHISHYFIKPVELECLLEVFQVVMMNKFLFCKERCKKKKKEINKWLFKACHLACGHTEINFFWTLGVRNSPDKHDKHVLSQLMDPK